VVVPDAVGVNDCVAVVTLLLHIYVLPPPAVSVDVEPKHMLIGFDVAVIVGKV